MVKIGIIGAGSISASHLAAYRENPDAEVVAICDIVKERAEERARQFNIKGVYSSADEMLSQEQLDAVSVCVWNSAHAECTIKALEAGCHVLCEKPMATSAADAERMLSTAKRMNKLLMIGFVLRFSENSKIIEDLKQNGVFGDFYYAKATYTRRNGNPGGWFGDKARSGGGPVIDLGVHYIDKVRYHFGNPKPVSVYAVTYQKLFDRKHIKTKKGYYSASHSENDICDVEDMASALIRFENGSSLQIEVSFSLNQKEDIGTATLYGDRGGVSLSPFEIYTELDGYMVDITPKAIPAEDFQKNFNSEIKHFTDCFTKDIPCRAPAEDGVEIMRILDAVYRSAETGHEVTL